MAAELDVGVSALLAGGAPQHDVFAGVLDALRGRARVLIVEDLHWADQATLDLVRYLARRVHGLPLLLVLSYRDSLGADHPLRPVLGDLVSSPDARRLQLVPLSRTAVAELLSEHPLDPDDVHRRTAGNPFFVSQILAQPESPLPESVRDAVIARAAALPEPARRCLLHLRMIEALEWIGGEASVLVHHRCPRWPGMRPTAPPPSTTTGSRWVCWRTRGIAASWAIRWPTGPTWPRSAARAPRRCATARWPGTSPTSWTTSCCGPPPRSRSR